MLPPQRAKGAVHSTPLPQQAWPSLPQAPPWQPPAEQVPWVPLQAPALATQRLVLLSQQPPPLQTLPSQQTPPASPQGRQVLPSQARPDEVQKSLARVRPVGSPGQQRWPLPPQGLPPVLHEPLVQVPT